MYDELLLLAAAALDAAMMSRDWLAGWLLLLGSYDELLLLAGCWLDDLTGWLAGWI